MSSSAKRTCSECSSASEYTATVLIPSSRHAQITRSAISPRLAIRILLNTVHPHRKEPVTELDGFAVLHVRRRDLAVGIRLDLVHELHGFDDAEHLALADPVAHLYERGRARLGRPVKGADDGRLDDRQVHL